LDPRFREASNATTNLACDAMGECSLSQKKRKSERIFSFARLEMKQATQTGYELGQSSGQEKCQKCARIESIQSTSDALIFQIFNF
jgi:hypothetical protein